MEGIEVSASNLVHATPCTSFFSVGHYAVVACESEDEAPGEAVSVNGSDDRDFKRANQIGPSEMFDTV